MATYLELVTLLKPDLLKESQVLWAEKIANSGREYHPESWHVLNKTDLVDEKVQVNVMRTISQLEFGNYEGIANEMLSSLLDWTGGMVAFKDFPPDVNEFYQRIFGFIGFQNFSDLKITTQVYLLGSRFLPLGPMLGLDILTNVELHFTKYCAVDVLQSESQVFTTAIANNQTLLFGTPISEWIADFLAGEVHTVDEYLKTLSINGKLIKESEQELLGTILDLYIELITGVIWKSVEKSDCVHGHIEEMVKEKSVNLSSDDLYLQKFSTISKVEKWLEDAEEIGIWLQSKSDEFAKKLFIEVAQKVNLHDEHQLELITVLTNTVAEIKPWVENLVLFNESTSQFEWNPDLLT